MSKDDLVYIKDIFDCIVKINKFLDAVSLEEFAGNDEKQDAVIRNYEVMGEAVSRIKNEYKLANANVPWRNIKSMSYDEVDVKLIYKSAKKDLSPLKSALEILLNANTEK